MRQLSHIWKGAFSILGAGSGSLASIESVSGMRCYVGKCAMKLAGCVFACVCKGEREEKETEGEEWKVNVCVRACRHTVHPQIWQGGGVKMSHCSFFGIKWLIFSRLTYFVLGYVGQIWWLTMQDELAKNHYTVMQVNYSTHNTFNAVKEENTRANKPSWHSYIMNWNWLFTCAALCLPRGESSERSVNETYVAILFVFSQILLNEFTQIAIHRFSHILCLKCTCNRPTKRKKRNPYVWFVKHS